MTTAEVIFLYQQRAGELQSALAAIQNKQTMALAIVVLAALAAIASGFLAYTRRAVPGWYPPLALTPALVAIRNYGRRRWQVRRLNRLHQYFEQGQARLDGRWAGGGKTGEEFLPPDHPHAADLNLFGQGSLFERLCTTRTHLGSERLARYLTGPAGKEEAVQRQKAVRDLRARMDLREQIALLGKYDFEESKWRTFADWLDSPAANAPKVLKPALLVSSSCLLALTITALVLPSAWQFLWGPILAIVLLHCTTGAVLLRWVRATIDAAGPVAGELSVIREGLALLASQSFSTRKLADLSARSAAAEQAIAQLDPWLFILRERSKDWWYQLSLWLALGTQSALAIDAWRIRHKLALLDWLDAWAEFETLNALACYAFENPEDCWPEMIDGDAFFEAVSLGHPLLRRDDCVRNDVCLGRAARFWMVSGSNMAGKSTLLRSIGVASVLALAGAPVRAVRLKMAAVRVMASISVADSLREGQSKFLAEVQRLREMLDASLADPVLFLIDEIFSGTNSRDRQIAADAVIRTLVERLAIGVVSTHDLALTALAAHQGTNVHMGSAGSGPLDFDYRVKPGVTEESNALAIARLAGVPV